MVYFFFTANTISIFREEREGKEASDNFRRKFVSKGNIKSTAICLYELKTDIVLMLLSLLHHGRLSCHTIIKGEKASESKKCLKCHFIHRRCRSLVHN
jgi:hypothetical protein